MSPNNERLEDDNGTSIIIGGRRQTESKKLREDIYATILYNFTLFLVLLGKELANRC